MAPSKRQTLYVLTVHSDHYRNNLFFDEVRRGINIESNINNVNVEFLFGFDHTLDFLADACGIIFAPDGTELCRDFIHAIKNRYQVPIVQIDNQVLDQNLAAPFDAFIGTDNVHGGMTTARYLRTFLPQGSIILPIAGSKNLPYLSYNLRLQGFVQEAQDYFHILPPIFGEFDHKQTYHVLQDYLRNDGTLPDAIFAFNDDSAIIASKAIAALAVERPLFIAGFDGSAAGRVALAKQTLLCSYDQDPEDLGRQAFTLFLSLRDGKAVQKESLLRGTLLTTHNIGNTFHAGVTNFLDRALTPFSFRKRRYTLVPVESLPHKTLRDYRNELICPIYHCSRTHLAPLLKQIDADKFILVSDNHAFLAAEQARILVNLRAAGLSADSVQFAGGEKNKTPETLLQLLHSILANGISKKSCLVLLGGGITGNVGGLAASLLYRGIRFVHVPTTVMHMVDSSTGGKQAVDSAFGKNSIGSFFEPEFILIDPTYLETLPDRELRNGIAESVKHALCQDATFYDFILGCSAELLAKRPTALMQLIARTIELKVDILNRDSYELNEGMALVYGHTLGNAVESASDYAITHGEAVSIGMVAAAHLAVQTGVADASLITQHTHILSALQLPTRIPFHLSLDRIMSFLKYDKKYVDTPYSFVLLAQMGQLYMKNGVIPKAVAAETVSDVVTKLYDRA